MSPSNFDFHEAIVERLETGVLVLDLACRRVLYANELGRALLRAFGGAGAATPPPLVDILSVWFATQPPHERFRESLPLTTPQGARHYARAKLLDARGGRLLLVVNPHVLRDRDLRKSLHARYGLGGRDAEIVQCVRAGLTNAEISERLTLTEGTVKNYLSRIFSAMAVRSRTQLLAVLETLGAEEGERRAGA